MKRNYFFFLLLLLSNLTVAQNIIDFEDGGADGTTVPLGYHGFNWDATGSGGPVLFNDITVYPPPHCGTTGYATGTVSPVKSITKGGFALADLFPWRIASALPNNVCAADGTTQQNSLFCINSMNLTAAWRDNMEITISGLAGGVVVHQMTVTVSSTVPVFVNLGWCDVDAIEMNLSDLGTDGNYSCSVPSPDNAHLVIDNFSWNPVPADLELTKSVDVTSAVPGQQVTYTLTVTNTGDREAICVNVEDVLPAGLTFNGSDGAYNSGTGIWTIGTLPAYTSATLNIMATVTATSGSITNYAEVASSETYDPDSTPNNGNGIVTEDDEAETTFTVDVLPPVVLNCAADTTVSTCQTQADIDAAFAAWLATATATGGCNGVLTNDNTGAPLACGGATTVTFTYTSDCAPLTTTCQATFTVTAAPTLALTCPVNTTAAACQTQAAVDAQFAAWLATATATGGCNGVLTNDNTGAPLACGGTTTVTFTYTSDCAPLTTTCTATFTVTPSPTVALTCPVSTTAAACQTQAAVDAAFAAWLATATATGGCNGVLTNDNTGAPLACGGTTTVTFTYTSDCAPLTTTCQATFTVTAAPTVALTCPVSTTAAACQTQAAVDAAFAAWLATATATGGCNGTLTNDNTGAPLACGGTTTVTFTYTSDCAPLTTTCQATFTVTPAPTVALTCPVNTTAAACQTQAAVDAAFAAWLATATATGGCNGVLTNDNTGAPLACGGATTVTFTYTSDCAPLTTTCQATFTVTAAPTVALTCPVSTTATACQTQAAVDAAFAAWLATATATGGCNGTLTNDNTGAPSACGSTTTVTFTYTSDCAPLTTTCQATFTVTAPPTVALTCPVNTTATACQTQAAVDATFAAWLATATATGGCNGVLTNDNTGAPLACGGATTVTFTYTSDCTPLTTTCQATFTVTPPTAVELTCPADMTVGACQDQAAVDADFATWLATASASGGCNGVLTNDNTGAPLACGGTTTVTFTYTSDCAPLTTTCQATFTVTAPTAVALTCPADLTVNACQDQAAVDAAFAAWLATASASGGCNGVLTNDNTGAPLICSSVAVAKTVVFTYVSTCAPLMTTCQATFTLLAYPDFTVPANGASTVACPSQIVQPTPPVVLDACGKTLTPSGPVIVNNPDPITCEGDQTFTWTYTDCSGHAHTWSHTVTVEQSPFAVPANGGSTVACPDQTDVQPTPPVVTSDCGEVLTPVITSSPKPDCEGNRNWFFTYTDCENNTAVWIFTYTIDYLDFTVPANEVEVVQCPLNALEPTPPTVVDNCGKPVNMSGPVVSNMDNTEGCEGNRTYTWTYEDCTGKQHTWSKTYMFEYGCDYALYPNKVSEVSCIEYAVKPFPPTVYDCCGNKVSVLYKGINEDINEGGCSGVRIYLFTYRDCGGHEHDWNFTYYINDNVAPTGTTPNVDVTSLSCVAEVPCPDNYDFSEVIAKIVEEGDFHDNCKEPIVSLDGWSDLWQCSDENGDGVYTFGRTFYFVVKDECGNAFPDLIPVTFSGVCQPICTFTQGAWGNEGDIPASASSDTELIQTLLDGYGPLTVGGNNRSLSLTDAQCTQELLPASGGASMLANCHQTNCTVGCNPVSGDGRLKNSLAANMVALMLNVRYNMHYNGLTLDQVESQSLGCIEIHECLFWCSPSTGECQLRISDQDGSFHYYPYTIGGLAEMANEYLDGGLALNPGQQTMLTTMMGAAINNVNNYWDGCEAQQAACGTVASDTTSAFDVKLHATKQLLDERTDLYWAFSGNASVDEFIVERSANGEVFEDILSTDRSNADIFQTIDYYPLVGKNYYRLRLMAGNNVIGYSNVEMVEFEPLGKFTIFPNPASRTATINLESIVGLKTDIYIYNGMGLRLKVFSLSEVSDKYYKMDLRDLTEGSYWVLIDAKGRRPVTKQLIIGSKPNLIQIGN